jgi:hypothetical protein
LFGGTFAARSSAQSIGIGWKIVPMASISQGGHCGTVVSFPLLLDREVDFVTAMVTSVRAAVTLSVLGHATWHLYRRLVVPVAQKRNRTQRKRAIRPFRRPYSIDSGNSALQKPGAGEKTIANCCDCAHIAPMSERTVVSAHTRRHDSTRAT